jgi:hypothetical protein
VRSRLPAAALCLLALTGCSAITDTADRAADCVGLARDVAASGLSGTPTVEDAEAAVRRLDDRIAQLGEGEVRDAATALRDRLRELAEAARAGDAGEVQRSGDAARQAARDAAAACSIPVDQFLG